MLGLRLAGDAGPHRILCLGAHADDIEIGCGGTLLKLLAEYPDCIFRWVVFSASPERAAEARDSAALFLAAAREKEVLIGPFQDAFFPYQGSEIKHFFERELASFAPNLVFTHYRHDRHQDHRVLSDLTWNTFRNHLILEYEIPKYDGDLGQPSLFVHLDEATCASKIEYLMTSFETQRGKSWFSEEIFMAMLRLRGVESRSRFAEAFHCRKLVFL